MNICWKYISIFVVELFVFLLLSTNAFTATAFYILTNDSNQKVDCDFLEIKNNLALCTANNLLITYDLSHVKHIEVVRNGTSQHFQNFTQETINRINELNSDKSATKKIREQENNKKKILDFIPDSVQSLISNFKSQSGNNSLNTILLISGLIVFLIGSVGFLIATFRAGILWGLSCMFLPFVSFAFLFVHWKTAAKPFLISMLGIAILFLSTIFSPTAGAGRGISKFNSGTNRANTNNNNAAFQCSGKIYCSEMSSCAEAKFYLRNCPGTKMDGNNDGIPCEKQWCVN
jgi:uncharacterized membrane protein